MISSLWESVHISRTQLSATILLCALFCMAVGSWFVPGSLANIVGALSVLLVAIGLAMHASSARTLIFSWHTSVVLLLFALPVWSAVQDSVTMPTLLGFSGEIGSPLWYVCLLTMWLCGIAYIRSGYPMSVLLLALSVTGSVAAFLSLGSFMPIPLSPMADPVFIGLVLLASIGVLAPPWIYISILLCAALLIGTQSIEVAIVSGVGALFLVYRRFSDHHRIALGVLIIGMVGATYVVPHFYDTSRDGVIRPSFLSTAHVIAYAIQDDTALFFTGGGPLSFERAWAQYRPDTINRTALWNIDFKSGSSLMSTLLIVSGIPFVFMWCAAVSVLVGHLFTTKRGHVTGVHISVLAVLFFTIVSWFVIPSSVTIYFAVFFMGTAMSAVVPLPKNHAPARLRFLSAGAVCIIASGVLVWLVLRAFAVGWFEFAMTQEDLRIKQNALEQSLGWEALPETYLAHADVLTEIVQANALDKTTFSELERSELHADIEKARHSALSARELRGVQDMRYWLSVARTQQMGQVFGLPESPEDITFRALQSARAYARAHPLPVLSLAGYHLAKGDMMLGRQLLSVALIMRPNFPEAEELLTMLPQN